LGEDDSAVSVAAVLTACERTEELLAPKFGFPSYWAVIECEPAVNDRVLKAATPPFRARVRRTLAPSMKVTIPVGVLLSWVVTVAAKVTGCP